MYKRQADEQPVGGTQGFHIELAAGVFHKGGGEGIDLQLAVVGGGHGADAPVAVSYTHLDVYKRQQWRQRLLC